jgi:UDP-N-acetylmuramoylalanine--D-glutamate ligase
VASLDEAVTAAALMARPGDVVLLAPGYKSFDQFRDFEDRGRAFGEAVGHLAVHPAEKG